MGCSASRPITVMTNKAQENSHHHKITATTTTTSESSSSSSPNLNFSSVKTRKAFSLTTPLIHHPSVGKGDTHHLVSLTSTTYGYASLLSHTPKNDTKPTPQTLKRQKSQSLSPDSVINTWELMHDLDDDNDDEKILDLRRIKHGARRPESCRYEFNYSSTKASKSKPLWQHLSEESLLSKMDPNVGATYRRALSSRHLGSNYNKHSKIRSLGPTPTPTPIPIPIPIPTPTPTQTPAPVMTTKTILPEDRVVVYFTSLRGVRKTHEDCCAVRAILRSLGVAIDERDVSMDAELRQELRTAMGVSGAVGLPQVFVGGRHAGGAEEVRRMHECGELAGLVKGMMTAREKGPCNGCGDVRFVPCNNCSGSRKVFVEEEGELRRCKDCNENGLTRCSACCSFSS